MELLCTCGAINATALPDACVCHRCGRVWIYERTAFANDWRCIKDRAQNNTGPWPCPVCGHRLDSQGTEHGSRTVHDLFCHHCAAHITLRIPL